MFFVIIRSQGHSLKVEKVFDYFWKKKKVLQKAKILYRVYVILW